MKQVTAVPLEFRRFVARFDRGEYWHAHEELELLWLRERDMFSKGLIHLAAGLLHAHRGNWRGARSKINSARVLIADGVPGVEGVHLEELRNAVDALCTIVAARAAGDDDGVPLPDLKLAPLFPEGTVVEVEPAELPYRVRRHDAGYRPGRAARRRD